MFEQGSLRIQHPLEVRITFAILRASQHQRAFGRHFGLTQDAFALQGFDQSIGRIVRLACCLANLVAVGFDQLLQPRILDANVVADLAVIEQIPAQAWAADQIQISGRATERVG
ncbi:hypothetical protein D3C84_1031480 [compost metagenome]